MTTEPHGNTFITRTMGEVLADRSLLERLQQQAKNLECNDCYGYVWPARHDGTWALRCIEGFEPNIVATKLQLARREGAAMQELNSDIIQVVDHPLPAVMPAERAMTIAEWDEREELRTHVISRMVEGKHYGQAFPGAKGKSLLEPGAEFLRSAFGIQFEYDIVKETEDLAAGEFYYEVRMYHLLAPGVRAGGWSASAWSKESRFNNMETAMLPHNVRDRAIKRAFVFLIKNVTGCSGDFQGEGEEREGALPRGTASNTTDGAEHAWLKTCPTHNRAWMQSAKMREPGHPPEKKGGDFCNQSTVLKPMLDAELEQLSSSWDRKEINEFLKVHFGGTWSALSPKNQLSALDQLKRTPPPSTQDPSANPATTVVMESSGLLVDTASGEIHQPMMEDMPDAEQAGMEH
jgi:hypothetical protein